MKFECIIEPIDYIDVVYRDIIPFVMFPSKKKNVDDISKDFSENRKLNGCNNMSNSEYIIYICHIYF